MISLFLTLGRAVPAMCGPAAAPLAAGRAFAAGAGLLGTGFAESGSCYGLAVVYFATFMQVTYGMSLIELAIPLAVFALGNIVGTVLGGQLADRLRDRLLTFAVAMALSVSPRYCSSPGIPALGVGGRGVRLRAPECAGPTLFHGLPRICPGGCPRHGARPQRHIGQRRLDRRRSVGGGHDRLVGFEGFGPLIALLALLGTLGALLSRRSRRDRRISTIGCFTCTPRA